MANTFHQIELHIVFSVKYREALLADEWRKELYKYIRGVIHNNHYVPVMIGGWRDHIHILLGCGPKIDIPNLVKDIKLSTNQWLQPRFRGHFAWQDGYGVFSVSKGHEQAVAEYIRNQEEHHKHVSMTEEFRRLLYVNGISYDDMYLPREPI